MKLLASLIVLVPSLALAGDPKGAAPAGSKQVVPPKPPVAKTPSTKPAPELGELAGALAGTWKCVGKASTDGADSIDTKATMSNRADLDTYWMQTNFTATMGKETYKSTSFTGYNNAEQKFFRTTIDNKGGTEFATAVSIDHGMADKWAIVWDGELRLTTATAVVKTKHAWSSNKDGLAISDERSIDGGKTWAKAYDALCTKK